MENPEEILHCLEEFSKFKPKDIPRELEEYLCFVAKTGDPVYQWSSIKHLFKEKLISVVNEFYESCPLVDIPPHLNVEVFNYDTMKSFILEKLETFAAAPFTVQRICELLTSPRKEYNRIDKFMRALEKNILVVSTVEPGCKNTENGESIVNGLESEHLPESSNCSSEINVVEMEESPAWHKNEQTEMQFQSTEEPSTAEVQDTFISEVKEDEKDSSPACSSSEDVAVVEESQKEFIIDAPIDSSAEESTENVVSLEINVDALPSTQVDDEVSSEPVVSSEVLDEVTESEAVSSAHSNEPEVVQEHPKLDENDTQEECLKQADSTTSSKSPQSDETVPTVCNIKSTSSKPEQSADSNDIQESTCVSSETEHANSDSDSNQSSASTEPDTGNEVPSNDAETDSNEAKEMVSIESEESVSYDEDSSSSPADTTKGYERPQIESSSFEEKIDENKDEEISSSDKVVMAVPNTSIDDISDDESEAEAEVPKETIVEDTPKEQGDVPNVEPSENESEVTASCDDINKDCQETPMEIDSKEKADFNEAEAACEST